MCQLHHLSLLFNVLRLPGGADNRSARPASAMGPGGRSGMLVKRFPMFTRGSSRLPTPHVSLQVTHIRLNLAPHISATCIPTNPTPTTNAISIPLYSTNCAKRAAHLTTGPATQSGTGSTYTIFWKKKCLSFLQIFYNLKHFLYTWLIRFTIYTFYTILTTDFTKKNFKISNLQKLSNENSKPKLEFM